MAEDRAAGGQSPLVALYRLVMGYRISQAIYAAASLGLADLLKAGPRGSAELAEATGTHGPSLERLLRALVSFGVLSEPEAGRFGLTPLGELLRSDVPHSLRWISMLYGSECRWRPWGELLESVRTGEPAFDRVYGMGTFDYFARNPAAAEVFDRAMIQFSETVNPAVAAGYDFSAFGTLVDVGGGRGSLLASVLQANPAVRGVLFDLPAAIEAARPLLAAQGLAERCELVAGSFFEAVPAGGDAYLLKVVLHDWDDERATAILRRCRAAMNGRSKLLVVEMVIPPENEPYYARLIDLNMLVITGGRERTEREFRALLEAAGFTLQRVIPTRSPLSVLEAVPS